MATSMLEAEEQEGAAGSELGAWLVAQACGACSWEAGWLAALARFDRARQWATGGALSCADWLVGRARLARSTAFEKLRVAHELARRPLVAEAFAAGEITYCAVREITRATGTDPAIDETLVDLARTATVLDVRPAVHQVLLLAEQDREPLERQSTGGRAWSPTATAPPASTPCSPTSRPPSSPPPSRTTAQVFRKAKSPHVQTGRRAAPRGPDSGTADRRRRSSATRPCATMTHMSTVGIRALQQHASGVVSEVAAGKVVTITDRGRPVAIISPIGSSRLDQLIDSGAARPPKRAISDLAPPSEGAPLSELLRAMRSDEDR